MPSTPCCDVVELRQYITYPGKRDELITMFDRDINDPHRFTWLRGFASMAERKQALGEFYFGALWKSWAGRASATLYDNDDVLLLHPAAPGSAFIVDPAMRAPRDATASQAGFVVATIYYSKQEAGADFIRHFDADLAPVFTRGGARILARYVSEKSSNTFERLPVRENVNVYVWFAHFADRAVYEQYLRHLANDHHWRDDLFAPLYKSLARAPETLMLTPSVRSQIR
ncbi:NIPSNAP family protein [Massilia sp. TWR1-2-2]|uniref:NIPSNAP family protein n=1 Tax=Massilia sp. TWR1-2-2 TaxID=2804584 RepID=UPI003CF4040C